jgi:hypothetical protein
MKHLVGVELNTVLELFRKMIVLKNVIRVDIYIRVFYSEGGETECLISWSAVELP